LTTLRLLLSLILRSPANIHPLMERTDHRCHQPQQQHVCSGRRHPVSTHGT
jgi:hypothetical protein